jgi:hypothetical protein
MPRKYRGRPSCISTDTGMSALLPESLHALGWPANASAGLAEAVAGALAVLNASLAPPEPAPATPAPASAASAAPASAAPVHPPVRAIALALILAAVFAAVTLEARDWLVRKRALALEQAFA